jgi:hypothetical protein
MGLIQELTKCEPRLSVIDILRDSEVLGSESEFQLPEEAEYVVVPELEQLTIGGRGVRVGDAEDVLDEDSVALSDVDVGEYVPSRTQSQAEHELRNYNFFDRSYDVDVTDNEWIEQLR